MNEKIEMIRQLAYYIWEREGRPRDRALQNWLEAESTVAEPSGPATATKRKSAKRSTSKAATKAKGTGSASAKKQQSKSATKRSRKKS
jgi:hypothetical protein